MNFAPCVEITLLKSNLASSMSAKTMGKINIMEIEDKMGNDVKNILGQK